MKRSTNDPAKLRGLFQSYDFFEAVERAWPRVVSVALHEDAAFRLLHEAMQRWGRKPPPHLVFAAGRSLHGVHPLVLFAVVFAAHRWHRGTAAQEAGMAALGAALRQRATNENPAAAVWLAFWPLAVDFAAPLDAPGAAPVMRWEVEGALGSALAMHRDLAMMQQGLSILRRVRAEQEAALPASCDDEEGVRVAFQLGRTLANLGQTLHDVAGRLDGDLAYLEECVACHDAALGIPARTREPGNRYHSLRMRATARKSLAARVAAADPVRAGELLDGALADVEDAVLLYRSIPELQGIDGPGILRNLVNTLLAVEEHRDALGTRDVAESKLILDRCEEVLTEIRRHPHPRGRDQLDALEWAIAARRGRIGVDDEADVEQRLRSALNEAIRSRLRPGGHGVEREAARHAVAALARWASTTSAPLPAAAWPAVAELLAWLEPEEVGLDVLDAAMRVEAGLLLRESGHPRCVWDPLRYLGDAWREFDRRAIDCTLSVAERRVYAGWTRLLAGVRFAWAAREGGPPLTLQEELALLDRSGSSAWRSDLTFFGVGPARDGADDVETHWRCHLYRTRWERDYAAAVLEGHALVERLPPTLSAEAEALRRSFTQATRARVLPSHTPMELVEREAGGQPWRRTVDGFMIAVASTPESARREMSELEVELLERMAHGEAYGWHPARHEPAVVVEPDEVRAWLVANPEVGVLIVGEGEGRLLRARGADLTVARLPRLDASRCAADVDAYCEARDDYSFGTEEDCARLTREFGDALSRDAGSTEVRRAHAAIVATRASADQLDGALARLIAFLASSLEEALSAAHRAGLRHLLVLSRDWARDVPWPSVVAASLGGAARIAVAGVETLAQLPRAPVRAGPHVLYVGGTGPAAGGLSLGRTCLSERVDVVAGPLNRDGFEDLISSASSVSVFAHGQALGWAQHASGILLDAALLDEDCRYGAWELRGLHLRGARRVELWACDSGREERMFRGLLPYDEPAGLDGALLLAGAEVVLSALWVQYALSAAMIAEVFHVRLRENPSRPEGEALAAAITDYRAAVGPGGVFAQALEARFRSGPCSEREAVAVALTSWRVALGVESARSVPVAHDVLSQLGRVVDAAASPTRQAEELLRPLRSPVAWAGWKLTLRSKEVLWPQRV